MFDLSKALFFLFPLTFNMMAFADFAPQEHIPGPFQFGRLVDYQTETSQNITQCIVGKDPVTGQISLQTQFRIIYLTQPVAAASAKPGVFILKDESNQSKKLELVF